MILPCFISKTVQSCQSWNFISFTNMAFLLICGIWLSWSNSETPTCKFILIKSKVWDLVKKKKWGKFSTCFLLTKLTNNKNEHSFLYLKCISISTTENCASYGLIYFIILVNWVELLIHAKIRKFIAQYTQQKLLYVKITMCRDWLQQQKKRKITQSVNI